MGLLIDGQWHDQWYDTKETGGKFVRTQSQFRHWVTADGTAGPTGEAGFQATSGRYHLYVSLACPWANRTLIMRRLKNLEEHISLSIVHPLMLEHGWTFDQLEGTVPDTVLESQYLYQVYKADSPRYSGRVTVPVLWDKKTKRIVSNESADIMRMFNTAFNSLTGNEEDYYPEDLQVEIDRMNDFIYDRVNNGVYKAGFATAQAVYDLEVTRLFAALSELEEHLETRTYLVGERLTEADIRLFTTLARFDAVYYSHFKCNLKRLVDFPNLWQYTRRLYQMPELGGTINMDHIKQHYYGSHKSINPTGIVPKGPELDWSI